MSRLGFIIFGAQILDSPLDTPQTTELPEGVISRQTVVSAPLDVEGHQVHAEALVLCLEQVVRDLLCEDVVKSLPGLSGQTHQESV